MLLECRAAEKGRKAFAIRMGETSLQIQLRPRQHLIRRGVPEEKNRFTHQQWEKSDKQTPVQDQRCQSGPSAKSSVIPCEGDSFKNYERLQISDLHFDKFPTPATFA